MKTSPHLNYQVTMVPTVAPQAPTPVDLRERDALLAILRRTAKQSPQMRIIIDKIIYQYTTGAVLRGVVS